MNILMLMAGGSEAFADAGHPFPKNLVEIDGLPLVERVIEQIVPLHQLGHRVICTLLQEEARRFFTSSVVRLLVPDAVVLEIPAPTGGAACTALLAVEHIDNEDALLILNGDQLIRTDLGDVLADFVGRNLDAGTVVFDGVHPRWSYVRLNEEALVVEAAEKRPISRLATAGAYYFARGRDFVSGVKTMIKKDAQVGGMFYICPVLNELILENAKVGVCTISREEYVSLATPQGVQAYDESLRARRAGHAVREA